MHSCACATQAIQATQANSKPLIPAMIKYRINRMFRVALRVLQVALDTNVRLSVLVDFELSQRLVMLNIKMFYDSYWVIRSSSWRIRSLCIHAYSFPFYNGLLHYALWHMPTSYWLSCLLTFTYAQPHPSMDLVYKGLCYIPIIWTLLRQSQSLLS